MEDPEVEPGLLPVFRLIVAVLLGLLLVRVLTLGVHEGGLPRPIEAPLSGLVACGFLLGYLSWPRLQRKLGSIYLPIASTAASIVLIVGQYLTLRSERGLPPTELTGYAWEQLVMLVFPLLLVSWQSRYRWVLLFSLGTGCAELALSSLAVPPAELESSGYVRVVFIRVFAFLALGYVVSRLVRAQRAQRRSLQEANLKLAHYAATLEQLTISRERNRLARELHDTLAHALSGIAVQLEAARSAWDADPEEARALLEQSLAATRSGLTETRRALRALRASPLEDLGLTLALRSFAATIAERSGLRLDLRVQDGPEGLSPAVEQGIYRIAQEALENVARHAQAHRVTVGLVKSDEALTLTVADDGRGFEPRAVDAEGHFGLQGMRERAEAMGGGLDVDSRPGGGTTVRLEVRRCRSES